MRRRQDGGRAGERQPDTTTLQLIGMLMNNKLASFARVVSMALGDGSIAVHDSARLRHSLINITVYYASNLRDFCGRTNAFLPNGAAVRLVRVH